MANDKAVSKQIEAKPLDESIFKAESFDVTYNVSKSEKSNFEPYEEIDYSVESSNSVTDASVHDSTNEKNNKPDVQKEKSLTPEQKYGWLKTATDEERNAFFSKATSEEIFDAYRYLVIDNNDDVQVKEFMSSLWNDSNYAMRKAIYGVLFKEVTTVSARESVIFNDKNYLSKNMDPRWILENIPVTTTADKNFLLYLQKTYNDYVQTSEYYKKLHNDMGEATSFGNFGTIYIDQKEIEYKLDDGTSLYLNIWTLPIYKEKAEELSDEALKSASEIRKLYLLIAKNYYRNSLESAVPKSELENFKKTHNLQDLAWIQTNCLITNYLSTDEIKTLLMHITRDMTEDERALFCYYASNRTGSDDHRAEQYLQLFNNDFKRIEAQKNVAPIIKQIDEASDMDNVIGLLGKIGIVAGQATKDGVDSFNEALGFGTNSYTYSLRTDYTVNDWEKLIISTYLIENHPNLAKEYNLVSAVSQMLCEITVASFMQVATEAIGLGSVMGSSIFSFYIAFFEIYESEKEKLLEGYGGPAATTSAILSNATTFASTEVTGLIVDLLASRFPMVATVKAFVRKVAGAIVGSAAGKYSKAWSESFLTGTSFHIHDVSEEVWGETMKVAIVTAIAAGTGIIIKGNGWTHKIESSWWEKGLSEVDPNDPSWSLKLMQLALKDVGVAIPDLSCIYTISCFAN